MKRDEILASTTVDLDELLLNSTSYTRHPDCKIAYRLNPLMKQYKDDEEVQDKLEKLRLMYIADCTMRGWRSEFGEFPQPDIKPYDLYERINEKETTIRGAEYAETTSWKKGENWWLKVASELYELVDDEKNANRCYNEFKESKFNGLMDATFAGMYCKDIGNKINS